MLLVIMQFSSTRGKRLRLVADRAARRAPAVTDHAVADRTHTVNGTAARIAPVIVVARRAALQHKSDECRSGRHVNAACSIATARRTRTVVPSADLRPDVIRLIDIPKLASHHDGLADDEIVLAAVLGRRGLVRADEIVLHPNRVFRRSIRDRARNRCLRLALALGVPGPVGRDIPVRRKRGGRDA